MPENIVKDSIFVEFEAGLLNNFAPGEKLSTAKRIIENSNGNYWWVDYYPAGDKMYPNTLLCIFCVEKAVQTEYTYTLLNSALTGSNNYAFVKCKELSSGIFKHGMFKDTAVKNGKVIVEITARFTVIMLNAQKAPPMHFLLDSSKHCDPDVDIVVGEKQFKVHNGYITMISPVFYAMFDHDTKEARNNCIPIPDFDFDIVKNAIDFCYGNELPQLSIWKVVDVLRFADKYDIRGVTTILEGVLLDNLTVNTFSAIADYAWQFNKDNIQQKCVSFFNKNRAEISKLEEFVTLSPEIVMMYLKESILVD
uniref:BTB domain-containing protein n=1 Tax=Panagrellus redivivus TaxID=6233 RepID=A0A7E4W537_PANRE